MKNKLILVIGRHPQIMETVLLGALTDDEAKAKFQSNLFDLVLFGGGVEDYSENDLRREFSRINPAIKMIRHYGGGSGLLFNEIQEALHN